MGEDMRVCKAMYIGAFNRRRLLFPRDFFAGDFFAGDFFAGDFFAWDFCGVFCGVFCKVSMVFLSGTFFALDLGLGISDARSSKSSLRFLGACRGDLSGLGAEYFDGGVLKGDRSALLRGGGAGEGSARLRGSIASGGAATFCEAPGGSISELKATTM